jgi:hypothetical protein
MTDIHSCSYYCTRPACVLAQRDELRDRLEQQAEPVAEPEETYKAVPMKTIRTGVVTWDKQAEPVVAPVQAEPSRLDWHCSSCKTYNRVGKFCRACGGDKEQTEPTEGNPSY